MLEPTVTNYEVSGILPSLHSNELACHSVMDSGRKHEPAGLETKDSWLFTAVTVARVLVMSSRFPEP